MNAETKGSKQEPKYGPVPPESAGWGEVMEKQKIKSRSRKIKQKGSEVPIVDTSSVVTTPEGGPVVVNIEGDGSMAVDEANLIMPEGLKKGNERATRRRAYKRRRKEKQVEENIKKGNT